jgi:hypothetical protein
MSLLRDIQDGAVDNSTDLPTILRKCKILAARLGNEPFKQWVEHELNGYKSIDDLPDYRILTVTSYGNFAGSFGSGLNNAPIPLGCLPEKYRDHLQHSYLTSPISAYVSLLDGDKEGNPQETWSPDLVARYGSKIYQGMNCISAWKLLPINALFALVDTVRNRILSFVLEIEGEAPDAGEAPPNSQPIPQERVTNIYNTYIAGNAHNVAAGGAEVSQVAQISIQRNDFNSLENFLLSQGVEVTDIKLLEDALTDNSAKAEKNPFGGKVGEWIVKMLGKSAEGALKITTDVASTVLTKAISQFLGLPT